MGTMDVIDYQATDGSDWKSFLERSNNGTLFHDLDFLAYHPAGRFSFQHLVFRQEGRTVALLPGGLIERDGWKIYQSPCGASVGGLVLPRGSGVRSTCQVVSCLKECAVERGWDGIEFRIGPSVYLHDEDDQL